jgi:hypothetical protein
MTKLSLAAAAVALTAGSAVAAAQPFAYKPGTQHYRLDQTVATTQTVQGMTQNAESRTAQFFSLALAEQPDGLGVTYVIDSVTVIASENPSPMQAQANQQAEAAAQSLKGRRIVGTVTPLGKVTKLADADSTAPGGEQLAAGFRGFLVPFPSADVRAGMTWTDTTTNNFRNMGGIDGTTTSIVTYTVAGDTTVHGETAWRVRQEGTLTMSGMGAAQGTDVAMSGTGTISGEVLVGRTSGVYLGGRTEQSQSITVEVPAANMTIPITNKVTTTIQHVGS